jgi:O-methyltransferase involved in polyketide biosynthesis
MAQVSDHASVSLTFKQPDQGEGDKAMRELVASLGEAFVSAFTPEEMAAKLTQHGFAAHEFLTPERAKAEYFTPPRSDLAVPRRSGIVYAAL